MDNITDFLSQIKNKKNPIAGYMGCTRKAKIAYFFNDKSSPALTL